MVRESKISPDEKIFVEFGVEDYSEANTKFLLVNNFWRGLIIDGSKRNINKVKNSDLYWKSDLKAIDAWVDRERINQLIGDSGFSGKIGILSIDIDGNDYWVWESIRIVDPVIVVVEWNSVFGPKHSISVPYASDFSRLKLITPACIGGRQSRHLRFWVERKGYNWLVQINLVTISSLLNRVGLVGCYLLMQKMLMSYLTLEIQEMKKENLTF